MAVITHEFFQDNLRLLLSQEKSIKSPNPQVPDEVPSAAVTGFNITEKLQDIYTKDELFQLHLSQVEIYVKELLPDPQPVLDHLSVPKARLVHIFNIVKYLIKHMDPLMPLPTSTAPLQLSHNYNYAKKVYVWNVIVRLRDWGQEVQLMKEEKLMCRNNTAL
ncbi:hypothetical protein GOODEAATRI_021643 [Goodea atripinnis]|uniref:Ciliary neurotrophic factor n=1 Tax=Goodea atripinnis TaxID=208336 RepID=A0ABV0PQK4_9TELE